MSALPYKHPFYEVTPQQKRNTQNEKHQAQWAKYPSWNYQKSCKVWLINTFGKKIEETLKRRWNKICQSCVCIRMRVRWCAYHRNFQYCACHLVRKYLVNLFIYEQLLVQNGKTTATSKQTLMFQKQTTTSEGLRTNGALACFETKSHWWMRVIMN